MASTGATRAGTERYKSRFPADRFPDYFRDRNGWWISSLGLGTYLGEPDEQTDRNYEEAISAALSGGCNLLDTAINYRFQRSERSIGKSLQQLFSQGKIARDEMVLSSKAGFISFDGDYPANPGQYFQKQFVEPGICSSEDLVAGCHCMTPEYLENQLDRSLQNLKVEKIDIYFLHNPETQLSEISRQQFLKRTLAAFKLLERKVSEGKIAIYGAATWNGFRDSPASSGYLSLEELIGLARDAGGEGHHFRALQLPFNFAMPEALLRKNQKLGSRTVSLLEAADAQKMIVLSSASILQGQLSSNLPDTLRQFFADFTTDAQRSIQFVRSTPGVTSALIGMSSIGHVSENLQVASKPPVAWPTLSRLFQE